MIIYIIKNEKVNILYYAIHPFTLFFYKNKLTGKRHPLNLIKKTSYCLYSLYKLLLLKHNF